MNKWYIISPYVRFRGINSDVPDESTDTHEQRSKNFLSFPTIDGAGQVQTIRDTIYSIYENSNIMSKLIDEWVLPDSLDIRAVFDLNESQGIPESAIN